MILISGNVIDINALITNYAPNSIEYEIVKKASSSNITYEYATLTELKLELNIRKNIINSAKELNKSGLDFTTFRKSKCNEDFWHRTEDGGFMLKEKAKPSEGINDIFSNSSKYGTECSTAIVIVFYRALLKTYPHDLFDMTFENLHLMNWHYIDSDLDINNYNGALDYLPGDCRYFKNPEVNTEKPEWQGENTIDLGDGTYYGHGIGIGNADEIIKVLNKHRKAEAKESAFLMNMVTRPNLKHLANIYISYYSRIMCKQCKFVLRYHNNY